MFGVGNVSQTASEGDELPQVEVDLATSVEEGLEVGKVLFEASHGSSRNGS